MALVPAVPDRDLFPITGPLHLEKAQAPLFKYLHAIGFYGDLRTGGFGPGTELLFGIFVPHDHKIKGLSGPEVADGHLM